MSLPYTVAELADMVCDPAVPAETRRKMVSLAYAMGRVAGMEEMLNANPLARMKAALTSLTPDFGKWSAYVEGGK